MMKSSLERVERDKTCIQIGPNGCRRETLEEQNIQTEAIERLEEVCKRIEAKLFFSKKTPPDTIYYKNAYYIVVTDRLVTNVRVSQFMELIGFVSD